MKLYLSSMAISPQQAPYFFELVGKKPGNIKFALIENAADVEENASFVIVNRQAFTDAGLTPTHIDLRQYHSTEKIEEALKDFDVLWFGGGNTFYLRWIMRESGLEQVIPKLIESGIVYAGGSAGAIVAGPTLKHFESVDDPNDAPELIEEGLGLVDIVPVPHYQNTKYGAIIEAIKKKLDEDGFKTMAITDEQAIVAQDTNVTVISARKTSMNLTCPV